MIKAIRKFFDIMRYIRRINTLEGQVEVFQETIKSEAYKKIMAKLDEEDTTKRLKTENIELRTRIKDQKKKINELERILNEKKRGTGKTIYRSTKSTTIKQPTV